MINVSSLGTSTSQRQDNAAPAVLRLLLIHDHAQDAADFMQRARRLQEPACQVHHITGLPDGGTALDDCDVILLGAAATFQKSAALLERLQNRAPGKPIVVLTHADDDVFFREMLNHGALDCLTLSGTDDRTLHRVLRHAMGIGHAQKQITWLKNFDPLTGLPNRDFLRENLRDAIVQAKSKSGVLAVLMLNLDRFKLVNETLGPSRGDKLLLEIATRLRGCMAETDLLARHNGDEFIVVSANLPSPQDATLVAQKMLNALIRPVMIEGHEVYVTASIGISIYPGDGEDVDILISNADAAVSRAKDMGRNHFQFYTLDMNAKTTRRLSLESEMRHALDRGEFILHYQPQFDLRQRRITGFEALVRWQHPELGLVPPNDFIPLAEETGLIAPLGEWVMNAACAQAKTWYAAGHRDLRMAVNLSSRQFFQENVLEMVTRALDKTHLPAGCLELELTESAVMQNPDEATVTLCLLHNMGIRIAIDDFGTGHSSLNHLKRFPIDCLKVDRSFVNDVTLNPEDTAIVQAIIAMAHSLKLHVVAEGVETIEQLRFLEANECDVIQGYLVSRPLTADQITRTFLPQTGSRPEVLPFGLAAARGLHSLG